MDTVFKVKLCFFPKSCDVLEILLLANFFLTLSSIPSLLSAVVKTMYFLELFTPCCQFYKKVLFSEQLIEAIQGVDKIMGQLMDGLKMLNLTKCINIIVVADHGKKHIATLRQCSIMLLKQNKEIDK